ncbi:HypC/HybG/HupF family hydrogenase formation chaperone [Candidatus Woesearchaeota archaeon]|nr:HypC/HybG/HupF family hydrogenase formation chaperone [Candidatus Woesearchaeota archaeon]
MPGQVLKIRGGVAVIDYKGELREAGTALLPDVKEGEYVIVSAKMIVQRVPEDEAEAVLALWDKADEVAGDA